MKTLAQPINSAIDRLSFTSRFSAVSKRFHKNNLGFTLVEILVVLAVIGILVALLMPALAKVREQGRSIVCLNNQRQIGAAILMYAGENDNQLPSFGNVVTYDYDRSWWVLVYPYLTSNTNANLRIGATYLRCPTEKNPAVYWTLGVNYGRRTNNIFAYEGSPPTYPGSMRLTQLAPTTFLAADCMDIQGTGGSPCVYSPLEWPFNQDADSDGAPDSNSEVYSGAFAVPYNHFGARHQGSAICVFADGSARKVSLQEWVTNKNMLWGP